MDRANSPPEEGANAGAPLAPERLAELARAIGLDLDTRACNNLVSYAQLLRRWNRVHNLTAISSDEEILTHHLLDCLAIVSPLELAVREHMPTRAQPEGLRFLDAGTGGGLPGIAMAIARPHWCGVLVDAVEKKCAFLRQVQVELGLRNITVRHARLETLTDPAHELIVSRAFASLHDFLRLTRGCLRPGGIWAAMKGRNPADEIRALPTDVQVLDTITLRVPLLAEQRQLLILRLRPQADADAGSH